MDTAPFEAAQKRAIERLEAKVREAEAKATDRFWSNGPFNVQRWVARGYNSAIGALQKAAPVDGESVRQYLSRVAEEVRALRDLGPDADDEAWFASAIDDASLIITME